MELTHLHKVILFNPHAYPVDIAWHLGLDPMEVGAAREELIDAGCLAAKIGRGKSRGKRIPLPVFEPPSDYEPELPVKEMDGRLKEFPPHIKALLDKQSFTKPFTLPASPPAPPPAPKKPAPPPEETNYFESDDARDRLARKIGAKINAVLSHLTEEKIGAANFRDLCVGLGVLIDKQRALMDSGLNKVGLLADVLMQAVTHQTSARSTSAFPEELGGAVVEVLPDVVSDGRGS